MESDLRSVGRRRPPLRRSKRIAALAMRRGDDPGPCGTRSSTQSGRRPGGSRAGGALGASPTTTLRSHTDRFHGRAREAGTASLVASELSHRPPWSASENLRWFDFHTPQSMDGRPLGAAGWGGAREWSTCVDTFDRLLGMLGVTPPHLPRLLHYLGYSGERAKQTVALTRVALPRFARKVWMARCAQRKTWLKSGCTREHRQLHGRWRLRRRVRKAKLAVKRRPRERKKAASIRKATKRRRLAEIKTQVSRQRPRMPKAIVNVRTRC